MPDVEVEKMRALWQWLFSAPRGLFEAVPLTQCGSDPTDPAPNMIKSGLF
jgi:hypothetical protein